MTAGEMARLSDAQTRMLAKLRHGRWQHWERIADPHVRHATFDILMAAGLIEEHPSNRRHYRITDAGREALRAIEAGR